MASCEQSQANDDFYVQQHHFVEYMHMKIMNNIMLSHKISER